MTDGVDWKRVPGATRPRVIPVTPRTEVGGFRFARVDDGLDADGEMIVSDERGRVTDLAERERLLGYLTACATVVEDNYYEPDYIDPTRRFAVQFLYRTDGVWVWSAAVEYYLRHHGVGVEPELRERIVRADYHAPDVPAEVVARALRATAEYDQDMQAQADAYEAAHRPPTDVPEDLQPLLEELGWEPGRDVSDAVREFLDEWTDELAELPFERDGYPRYEPLPPAVAAMNEFGGLVSYLNGPGITSAQIPFRIFPTDEGDDLMEFISEVFYLGQAVGTRMFQIGDVERGMGALVVDERGRVFATGPMDLYLGEDIHEALRRLLTGIRAQRLSEVDL